MKQFNPMWRKAWEIKRQVSGLEQKKDHGRVKSYKNALAHFKRKGATCSQCKRPMRPDVARIQIENKRENAPICFACIMGYKRIIK
jgi:recombinational DNA repair protein RecR